MNTYITDPADIEQVRNGTAKLNGKEVIITNDDLRIITKKIFFALKDNPDLAIIPHLGLSKKSTTALNQYQTVTVSELEELVLEHFTLTKEQPGVSGGPPRLEVLDRPPNEFWILNLRQGRWLTPEVVNWFPVIEQPKAKIITRP